MWSVGPHGMHELSVLSNQSFPIIYTSDVHIVLPMQSMTCTKWFSSAYIGNWLPIFTHFDFILKRHRKVASTIRKGAWPLFTSLPTTARRGLMIGRRVSSGPIKRSDTKLPLGQEDFNMAANEWKLSGCNRILSNISLDNWGNGV